MPFRVSPQVSRHIAAHRIDFQLLAAGPGERLMNQCCRDASAFQRTRHTCVRDVYLAWAELVIKLATQPFDDRFEAMLIAMVLDFDVRFAGHVDDALSAVGQPYTATTW